MSSQQSWAGWLLDAYANSVSAGPTEPAPDDDEANLRSSAGPNFQTDESSSSPYGPYLKTGRGGAGNFTWQTQASPPPPSGDLEAQKPSTLSERRKAAAKVEHIDTDAAVRSRLAQRPASQYVRVGRGFVPSNEVQQSPRSASQGVQPFGSPVVTTSPSVAHPGRGGAGNHAAAIELNERKENEKHMREQMEAQARREKIEQQVQNTLQPPPDAWLGGRRRSGDLPEREI